MAGGLTDLVRGYHRLTRHRFDAYAPGPGTLDWDAQPAPFRHFAGAPQTALPPFPQAAADPAIAAALGRPFNALTTASTPAVPLTPASLGVLLHLSFGITAWKSYGPDRWAVRANPSSGNLHPVEVYLILRGVCGLADGVYHYRPEHHMLECRATLNGSAGPSLHIALSSAMWREAWKYGERAFRYCQLDTGHAAGALSYAAAVLGWSIAEQPQVGTETLARWLGLDRPQDFPARKDAATEREEAEMLFDVACGETLPFAAAAVENASATWHGTASAIDPYPMYRWPAVEEIAAATRHAGSGRTRQPAHRAPLPQTTAALPPAAAVILRRRSAQRFDARHCMPRQTFLALLDAVLPRDCAPWNALAGTSRLSLVLFVHRVAGFTPGLYFLGRNTAFAPALPARMDRQFAWEKIPDMPPHIDLSLLTPAPAAELLRVARSLHCHQDIASNACFALGMLAEFDAALAEHPAAYRDLYREAGVIGQALYLAAEAHGLRGTGIGCYFDEPVHALLGLHGSEFQSLYHFTVGMPLEDARIATSSTFDTRISS